MKPAPPPKPRGARRIAGALLLRLALILALGGLFSAFSEFWFYRIRPGLGRYALVLLYGLAGYLFVLILRFFQVRGIAGFFVAAGLFGFAIEGIAVGQLYANLPFSIVWTPLAWHALFSLGLGYLLYRRVMAEGPLLGAVALNLAIGIGLGIWGAYLWNVIEADDGSVHFLWQPAARFADQFLFGFVLFIGAHALLDRVPPPASAPPRAEFAAFAALAGLFWLAGPALAWFPFSLVMPFLVLVSIASLLVGHERGRKGAGSDWLARFFALRIPPGRYLLSLLLPAAAIATYAAMEANRLEWESNVVVALITVPLSALYWLYALIRAGRPRARR